MAAEWELAVAAVCGLGGLAQPAAWRLNEAGLGGGLRTKGSWLWRRRGSFGGWFGQRDCWWPLRWGWLWHRRRDWGGWLLRRRGGLSKNGSGGEVGAEGAGSDGGVGAGGCLAIIWRRDSVLLAPMEGFPIVTQILLEVRDGLTAPPLPHTPSLRGVLVGPHSSNGKDCETHRRHGL